MFYLSLLLLLALSRALKAPVNVDGVGSFLYVGRFAFSKNSGVTGNITCDSAFSTASVASGLQKGGGLINYTLTIPYSSQQRLLIFSDYRAWTLLSADTKSTCSSIAEKSSLEISLFSNQPYLTSSSSSSSTKFCNTNVLTSATNSTRGGASVLAKGLIAFTSAAPTWGILVLANCNSGTQKNCFGSVDCQGPLTASGQVKFSNGDNFDGAFSVDEKGIFYCSLLFFLVQCLVVLLSMHTRSALLRIRKYHFIVKLIVASTILQFCALFLSMLYWLIAGTSGSKNNAIWVLESFATALANFCIILLLILLAKGLTIVRKTVSPAGALKIVSYSTLLFLSIIFAEAFALFSNNASSGVYFYATPPGVVLLCLRCVCATPWFLLTSITMVKTFELKKRFYNKFIWLYGAWFSLPAIFVLITISIDELDRTIFTYFWEQGLVLAAQISLLLLFNPTFATLNSSFPFHQNVDIGTEIFPSFSVSATELPQATLASSTTNTTNRGINVTELFAEIRDYSVGVRETLRILKKVQSTFSDSLEDWLTDTQRELND